MVTRRWRLEASPSFKTRVVPRVITLTIPLRSLRMVSFTTRDGVSTRGPRAQAPVRTTGSGGFCGADCRCRDRDVHRRWAL